MQHGYCVHAAYVMHVKFCNAHNKVSQDRRDTLDVEQEKKLLWLIDRSLYNAKVICDECRNSEMKNTLAVTVSLLHSALKDIETARNHLALPNRARTKDVAHAEWIYCIYRESVDLHISWKMLLEIVHDPSTRSTTTVEVRMRQLKLEKQSTSLARHADTLMRQIPKAKIERCLATTLGNV